MLETNVARAGAYEHLELTSGDRPSLLNDIPNSKILIPNTDLEALYLTLLDHHLLESSKDLGWLVCVLGESEINLGDFCSVEGTCVTDLEADVDRVVVEEDVTTDTTCGDHDWTGGETECG